MSMALNGKHELLSLLLQTGVTSSQHALLLLESVIQKKGRLAIIERVVAEMLHFIGPCTAEAGGVLKVAAGQSSSAVVAMGAALSPAPGGWAPPAPLAAFLAAGPPPVCLCFGSMNVYATEWAAALLAALRAAVEGGSFRLLALGRSVPDALRAWPRTPSALTENAIRVRARRPCAFSSKRCVRAKEADDPRVCGRERERKKETERARAQTRESRQMRARERAPRHVWLRLREWLMLRLLRDASSLVLKHAGSRWQTMERALLAWLTLRPRQAG